MRILFLYPAVFFSRRRYEKHMTCCDARRLNRWTDSCGRGLLCECSAVIGGPPCPIIDAGVAIGRSRWTYRRSWRRRVDQWLTSRRIDGWYERSYWLSREATHDGIMDEPIGSRLAVNGRDQSRACSVLIQPITDDLIEDKLTTRTMNWTARSNHDRCTVLDVLHSGLVYLVLPSGDFRRRRKSSLKISKLKWWNPHSLCKAPCSRTNSRDGKIECAFSIHLVTHLCLSALASNWAMNSGKATDLRTKTILEISGDNRCVQSVFQVFWKRVTLTWKAMKCPLWCVISWWSVVEYCRYEKIDYRISKFFILLKTIFLSSSGAALLYWEFYSKPRIWGAIVYGG